MSNEDDLAAFLRWFRREPPYEMYGGVLHVYPNGNEQDRAKVAICEELERRGLVRRCEPSPGYIFYEAVPEE